MSGFGDLTSGSAFYSEPNPEAIGSPTLKETGDLDRARETPTHATPPPYARYEDSGAGSFAALPTTWDKSMQPEIPDPAVVGPPMLSIPLIAAGLFTLWLLFKESK